MMTNSSSRFPQSAPNIPVVTPNQTPPVMKFEEETQAVNAPVKKDGELIRTVAHELRNPLGGISSLVDVLIEDGHLNSEQRDLLNLVKETANYSLHMVNELLEKKNQIFTEREPANISAIIGNCVNLLHHRMAAKRQQLMVSMPGDGELISINREGITRLIDNLLSNAIKFTPEGGLIRVTARKRDEMFEICVKDNGIGMPKAMLNTLFDGCSQTGREGTAGEQSFGLGLPICKQIAEEHGGCISVKSKPGKGTSFTVKFPLQASQPNSLVA